MKLLLATGNAGKLREIKKIIASYPDLNLEIVSLNELDIPEPDEPHETFMENSKHKAKYYAEKTGLPTLSEDSGLWIDALDGFPGVRTKEFTVEIGGLEKAYSEINMMLQNIDNKHASFVCAATIYLPEQNKFLCYEDSCKGQFVYPPRGTECFGYDPVYVPEGYTQTMAELGEDIKNKIGHRGKAVRGLLEAMRDDI